MRPVVIFVALFVLLLPHGIAQAPAELKHFSITTAPQGWSVRISAENMAREAFVLHLKGSVEIRLTRGDDQYLMLRADEADFHIDTGAVESRGNVSVRPETKQQ